MICHKPGGFVLWQADLGKISTLSSSASVPNDLKDTFSPENSGLKIENLLADASSTIKPALAALSATQIVVSGFGGG